MSSDHCSRLDLFKRIHDFVVAGAGNELTEDHWSDFERLLQENDDACRLYLEYVEASDLLQSILDTMSKEGRRLLTFLRRSSKSPLSIPPPPFSPPSSAVSPKACRWRTCWRP